MSLLKANYVQMGMQATFDAACAATFKHFGSGTFKFTDKINTYGFDMNVGAHSGVVELTSVDQTGSQLTLPDFPFSAEAAIWFFNQAIKALPGPASSFAFAFPTPGAAANTIKYFTWEVVTDVQAYEFPNGFISKFSIHGDSGNPWLLMNATVEGGEASATTATAALSWLTNRETLTLPRTTLKIDNLGTAPGTAAATTGWMKAFNLDCETGFRPGVYADGRSNKDYGVCEYGGYKLTGKIRALLNATAVTHIANARAGTGKNIQIKCSGSSSRAVQFDLPIIFTDTPEIGSQNDNGLQMAEFVFSVGDSTTTTAQSPVITCTASGSTTVT